MVGMEPAVKPAAAATRSGVVGVLATTGTLQSAKFAALLDRFATDVRVITQPCPGLVELIESGDLHSPHCAIVAGYVEPLLAKVRHHHPRLHPLPFLKPMLKQMIPDSISLIDTGAAVARHFSVCWPSATCSPRPNQPGRFWTSADPRTLRKYPADAGKPLALCKASTCKKCEISKKAELLIKRRLL
jgi:glutamate racemase